MNRTIAVLAVAMCGVCSTASALYLVADEGLWPKSWPNELEPLRKQARTLDGPEQPHLHYAIGFSKREEFESAWPHLVKVKTKGAPIHLVRGESFFLGKDSTAGVVVHCAPGKADDPATPPEPTYIELVVDGTIVDLNRIPLPEDTPIVDERFQDEKNKQK